MDSIVQGCTPPFWTQRPTFRRQAAVIVSATIVSLLVFASVSSVSTIGRSGARPSPLSLIPWPAKLVHGPGVFRLDPNARIVGRGAALSEARKLACELRPATGFGLPVSESGTGAVSLELDPALQGLGPEGYTLEVTSTHVSIRSAAAAGLFYGGQTLRQLFPTEIFSASSVKTVDWTAPVLKIEDRPRFGWRGHMLDVSRHFLGVDSVKRLIDNMALHKLNVFHWHLSDDDGWRIEIKKYPRLTQVGAWRGTACAIPNTLPGETCKRYGGFYTQDQVRDVVRYAAERHVQILPEIDLPGHSRALVTAYPWVLPSLINTSKSVQGHKANALSPAKEQNYRMIEEIFAELVELFPFEWFHIGGDEVNANLWKDCPEIKELLRREKLASHQEAQNYFTRRLESILGRLGRRMCGWNEIAHDSLLKRTGIMAWTGNEPGWAAVRRGFPTVFACAPYNYFDMGYPDGNDEPDSQVWAGLIDVERTYSFEPMPASTPLSLEERRNVLGVHSCLWTECVRPWKSKTGWLEIASSEEGAQYRTFPRLCALAEVGWSEHLKRSWVEFRDRLGPAHYLRLFCRGIKFRVPPPTVRVLARGQFEIVPPFSGAEVRFTSDGSDPTCASPLYRKPMVSADPSKIRARTYLAGRPSAVCSGPDRAADNRPRKAR